MSTVELAVKKVKCLSETEASALLDWLARQQSSARGRPAKALLKPPPKPRRKRKRKPKQTIADLKAWYDLIRGTTDWEPPRMPDDLVQRVRLPVFQPVR